MDKAKYKRIETLYINYVNKLKELKKKKFEIITNYRQKLDEKKVEQIKERLNKHA